MLSYYVVSGNSFNASLFLFRDYPKVVNCRRPTKKKEKKKEKKKKKKKKKEKKKRRPTRAGRVNECFTIGGRIGTRVSDDKINKKSRLTDKVYGQYTYQNVTACTILVNCTIPSLTHTHPTFGCLSNRFLS